MKKTLFILTFAFASLFSQGQSDSWKVKWNKKILLETGKQDEAANTKKIKKTDLTKNYSLEIAYKEANPKKEKEWIRSFIFFGETDAEVMRKDSTRSVKITAKELKALFGDKKKIRIYTIAIPSDPNVAATVRVRRVHLCTLELL